MHPLRTAKIIPFQSRRSVRPSPELVRGREPLGQLLLQSGVLSQEDLIKALAIQAREETQLGQILLNHGMVSEAELFGALARQSGADPVDLMAEPPHHHLRNIIDLELCLKENIVPWKHIGGALLIATSRPDRFTAIRRQVEETAGPCRMVLAPEQDIQQAVMQLHDETLVNKAETRTPHPHSCRDWQAQRMMRLTLAAAILLLAGFLVSPAGVLTALCALAITVLLLNIGLKLSTAISQIGPTRRRNAASGPPPRTTRSLRLPVVSILVPLYHEREVASRLIT
ncbi:MAG TPA: glycosyl transferase, partial [Rhodobacteraceae bacterium]|nr:glycosyl transferase [Paracoccaceae bacterium]